MFLCFGTGCPAASFDDLWKQVEKYERQDLPKSAYKVVGQQYHRRPYGGGLRGENLRYCISLY